MSVPEATQETSHPAIEKAIRRIDSEFGPTAAWVAGRFHTLRDLAQTNAKGINFSDNSLRDLIIKMQPHHSYASLAHLNHTQLIDHFDSLLVWWNIVQLQTVEDDIFKSLQVSVVLSRTKLAQSYSWSSALSPGSSTNNLDLLPGDFFSPYYLDTVRTAMEVKVIGRGGSGTVYQVFFLNWYCSRY